MRRGKPLDKILEYDKAVRLSAFTQVLETFDLLHRFQFFARHCCFCAFIVCSPCVWLRCALRARFSRGLLHNDAKWHNVVLLEGRARLIDFRYAHLLVPVAPDRPPTTLPIDLLREGSFCSCFFVFGGLCLVCQSRNKQRPI